MLMSATTNDSVEQLQKLVLHNPVTLDLLQSTAPGLEAGGGEPGAGAAANIEHFSIHCSRYFAVSHCEVSALLLK